MSAVVIAAQEGIVACDACQLLLRTANAEEPGFCARCGEGPEFRRPG